MSEEGRKPGGEGSGKGKRFALFDLDLTLVPYDTQLLFCNHVLRAEPWRRFYLFVFLPFAVLYGLKLIGDRLMKRIFMCYLWRMPGERLREHAEAFVEEDVAGCLYGEVVAEVARHRAEGRVTILNSASPEVYVAAIGRKLGFEESYGTRIVVGERMPFFPVIEGENNKGAAKLPRMRELLPAGAAEGGTVLEDSYAYSDSSADIPMMELAEHAVMVHPSARLRAHGEGKSWGEMLPERPYAGKGGSVMASLRQVLGVFEG